MPRILQVAGKPAHEVGCRLLSLDRFLKEQESRNRFPLNAEAMEKLNHLLSQ